MGLKEVQEVPVAAGVEDAENYTAKERKKDRNIIPGASTFWRQARLQFSRRS
jgi:hypothetical protein